MSKEAALNMLSGSTPEPTPSPSPGLAPTPEAVAPKPSVDSDRFAKLAAKEAQLQKEREAYKAQMEALKPIKEKIDHFNELKKTDKIAALKLLDFTEEDILNFVAGAEEKPEPTPAEIAAQAAREEIEKDRKERQTQAEKEQQERDEKNIKAFKDGIAETIAKEAETFEYLNHYGPVAQDIVYETILEFIKEDPTMTPLDAMREAMKSVEEYYEEESQKMATLKKFQSKLKPVEVEAAAPKAPERKSVVTPPRGEAVPASTPRKAPAPPPVPSKETRQQKRERLENLLRNGGRQVTFCSYMKAAIKQTVVSHFRHQGKVKA